MTIEKFVEDRKTPYSEIKDIVLEDDGSISFVEEFDLNHPLCPFVRIEIQDNQLKSISQIKHTSKFGFELMYGTLDKFE